jgi:hypothetical protein
MVNGAWRGNGRGRVDSEEVSDFSWNVDTEMMSSNNTKTSKTMTKTPLIKPIVE